MVCVVVASYPLPKLHNVRYVAAAPQCAGIKEFGHFSPCFFTSCMVLTAAARALERSLAMGASGVASRPTRTASAISFGAQKFVPSRLHPAATASATATPAASARVQLR